LKNVHLIAACAWGWHPSRDAEGGGVPGHRLRRERLPPMSTQLESLGIRIATPYAAENIPPDADLVVVGTRCRGGTRRRRSVPARAADPLDAQAVARFFIGDRQSIVVAGTHGRRRPRPSPPGPSSTSGPTRRSSWAGPEELPRELPARAGASLRDRGGRVRHGVFRQGAEVLHYRPRIVLLTSVEFDHADIYGTSTTCGSRSANWWRSSHPTACSWRAPTTGRPRGGAGSALSGDLLRDADGALSGVQDGASWVVRGTGESGG